MTLCGFFGFDALEQDGCRLVVRVLWDELAGKGFLQDGLTESVHPKELVVDLAVQLITKSNDTIQVAYDLLLFS